MGGMIVIVFQLFGGRTPAFFAIATGHFSSLGRP